MNRERFEELIQHELDGELAVGEGEELAAWLGGQPEARLEAERVRAAVRLLGAVEAEEPPAWLLARVMREVRDRPRPAHWWSRWTSAIGHQLSGLTAVIGAAMPYQEGARTSIREGGAMSSRKWLLAAVSLVALGAIGYFAVKGWPPVDKGSQATVGAAERYQKPQIKEGDVGVTESEVQAFMQSDVFDKLIKDKAAVAALANPAMQAALANANVAAALKNPAVQAALAKADIAAALANPAMQAAFAKADIAAALANPAMQAAFAKADIAAALAHPAMQAALREGGIPAALANPAVQAALANPAVQASLAKANVAAALAHPAMQAALAKADIAAALGRPAMQAALAQRELAAALRNPAMQAALAKANVAAQ
jgi:hypothetical protein